MRVYREHTSVGIQRAREAGGLIPPIPHLGGKSCHWEGTLNSQHFCAIAGESFRPLGRMTQKAIRVPRKVFSDLHMGQRAVGAAVGPVTFMHL